MSTKKKRISIRQVRPGPLAKQVIALQEAMKEVGRALSYLRQDVSSLKAENQPSEGMKKLSHDPRSRQLRAYRIPYGSLIKVLRLLDPSDSIPKDVQFVDLIQYQGPWHTTDLVFEHPTFDFVYPNNPVPVTELMR